MTRAVTRRWSWCGLILVAAWASGRLPSVSAQSLSYSSGQNVAPAYEGWEQDATGVKYFVFGYMNRNWQEEIDVPIGPDNGFSGGNADQGQPTHFLPRRNRFVFRVRVPDTFKETDELVWTLASKGKTEKAYASLRPDYKIDNVVRMSETGALGAGSSTPEIRANEPPVVKLDGADRRTVRVGQPLEIWTVVTDDGIPKSRGAGLAGAAIDNPVFSQSNQRTSDQPANARRENRTMLPPARATVGKNVGLHESWFVYRGAGAVAFEPPQIKVWEDTRTGANSPWAPIWQAPKLAPDGRLVVHVTFAKPGTYVLRALADDGGLTNTKNVDVTVTVIP